METWEGINYFGNFLRKEFGVKRNEDLQGSSGISVDTHNGSTLKPKLPSITVIINGESTDLVLNPTGIDNSITTKNIQNHGSGIARGTQATAGGDPSEMLQQFISRIAAADQQASSGSCGQDTDCKVSQLIKGLLQSRGSNAQDAEATKQFLLNDAEISNKIQTGVIRQSDDLVKHFTINYL